MRVTVALAMLGLLVGGCGEVVVDAPLDADHDGLFWDEEIASGTDPVSDDSDGDGHLDGAEVASGTNPRDAGSYPYKGGYQVDDCRDTIEATGNRVGQIADNWEALDQFGDTVRLHDFCNRYVLMTSAAFW